MQGPNRLFASALVDGTAEALMREKLAKLGAVLPEAEEVEEVEVPNPSGDGLRGEGGVASSRDVNGEGEAWLSSRKRVRDEGKDPEKPASDESDASAKSSVSESEGDYEVNHFEGGGSDE